MIQPSVALQGIKKRINIYHYANGAEKQTLKAILEGKFDQDDTAKQAEPVKAAPKPAAKPESKPEAVANEESKTDSKEDTKEESAKTEGE